MQLLQKNCGIFQRRLSCGYSADGFCGHGCFASEAMKRSSRGRTFQFGLVQLFVITEIIRVPSGRPFSQERFPEDDGSMYPE